MHLAQFGKINIVELHEVVSAIKITDFEEKITRFYSPSIAQDTKGKSAPCEKWFCTIFQVVLVQFENSFILTV